MAHNIHAIIMAGGSGTRFWPASRTSRPKQFLPLAAGTPLIRATVERVRAVAGKERTWIVTNAAQAAALPAVLPDFPKDRIIIEPEARDTAPCVALAVAVVGQVDPDGAMVLLPADHVIKPIETFHDLLRQGVALAGDDETLVTFGIKPTHPATGYGYIETGEPLSVRGFAEAQAFTVRQFREKPDRETAVGFLAKKNFLWNAGIFVWTVPAIRRAMQHGNPELGAAAEAMAAAAAQGDDEAVNAAFATAPKTSIDFAVMEKVDKIAVVRADLKWDDVGSFLALKAVAPRDGDGNVHLLTAGAQLVSVAGEDNVIYAEGQRTVALFGCKDMVVVALDDVVMVCPKSKAEDLKALVQRLREMGRDDLL